MNKPLTLKVMSSRIATLTDNLRQLESLPEGDAKLIAINRMARQIDALKHDLADHGAAVGLSGKRIHETVDLSLRDRQLYKERMRLKREYDERNIGNV